MNTILSVEEAIAVSKTFRDQHKKIVLVGGCFDILHIGHILFLTKAKEQADIVMVLLEHDQSIRKQKGDGRPINTQIDRAQMLAALKVVDVVVCLPVMTSNTSYDDLIFSLKPAIIATTKRDDARVHKERQAKALGIPLIDVVERVRNQSTSRVSALLEKEF